MEGFVIRSRLLAAAPTVWARVTTPAGINAELGPWLRMTTPAPLRGATLDDLPLGEPLGRAWLLLFGVLPVEWDALRLESRATWAFQEDSTMLTLRRWRHGRTVEADGDGCVVTDRLAWTPRLPGVGVFARRLAPALFRHRHRRLRATFGGEPLP
ncbi:MAG: hypothetical protein H6706_29455 [Myxococcales bacterium]|nr:hypothetical protein [Myxococcales bacterium]